MLLKALRRHLHLPEQGPPQNRCSGRNLAPTARDFGLLGVIVEREARRDLEGAADLPAVPGAGRRGWLLVVLSGKLDDPGLFDDKGRICRHYVPFSFHLLELRDVQAEDVPGLRLVERRLKDIGRCWLRGEESNE